MAKDKMREDEVIDEEFEDETADDAGLEDIASEEVIDEETTPDNLNAENQAVEATITASPTDIPELEGMQVGDSIRVTADTTIDNVDEDGNYTLRVIGYIPAEKEAQTTDEGAGLGGGMGGGAPGIEQLLGGGGAPPTA